MFIANLSFVETYRNVAFMNPLIKLALKSEKASLLKLFSKNDLNEEDDSGMTPLFYAIKQCSPSFCQSIIDLGCDVNHVSKQGITSLKCAVERGNSCIVDIIQKAVNAHTSNDKNFSFAQTSQDENSIGEENPIADIDNFDDLFCEDENDLKGEQDPTVVESAKLKTESIFTFDAIDNGENWDDVDISLEEDSFYLSIIEESAEKNYVTNLIKKVIGQALFWGHITHSLVVSSLSQLTYPKNVIFSLERVLDSYDLLTEDPFLDSEPKYANETNVNEFVDENKIERIFNSYIEERKSNQWNSAGWLNKHYSSKKVLSAKDTDQLMDERDHYLWNLLILLSKNVSKEAILKTNSLENGDDISFQEDLSSNVEEFDATYSLLQSIPHIFDRQYLYKLLDSKYLLPENIISISQKSKKIIKTSTVLQEIDSICSNLKRTIINIFEGNWRLVPFITIHKNLKIDLFYQDQFVSAEMGLLKAAYRFKFGKGAVFSTYAMFWMKAHLSRFNTLSLLQIRTPVYVFGKIERVKDSSIYEWIEKYSYCKNLRPIFSPYLDYKNTMGYFGNDKIPIQSVQISIDDNEWSKMELLLSDFMEPSIDGEQLYIEEDKKQKIIELVNSLKVREAEVIKKRFGLEDNDEMTLEEIGEQFHVTRERIRQIEAKALSKLKEKLIESHEKRISSSANSK